MPFRIAALALAAIAAPFAMAQAATEAEYSQAAFAAAQAAGKPILLHVTAPWCPTCAQQKPILAKLEADPAYADLQVFTIDFDSQKDLLRALNVRAQSTLIAYHGATEETRSTGATDPAAIAAVVARTKG